MEKVFALSHPDPHELEKAKRMLKVRPFIHCSVCLPSLLTACELLLSAQLFARCRSMNRHLSRQLQGLQMHLMVKVVMNICMHEIDLNLVVLEMTIASVLTLC